VRHAKWPNNQSSLRRAYHGSRVASDLSVEYLTHHYSKYPFSIHCRVDHLALNRSMVRHEQTLSSLNAVPRR
jgi:hypothetical protein